MYFMFHGCLLPKAFAATTETVNISISLQHVKLASKKLFCGNKVCEKEVLNLHQNLSLVRKPEPQDHIKYGEILATLCLQQYRTCFKPLREISIFLN